MLFGNVGLEEHRFAPGALDGGFGVERAGFVTVVIDQNVGACLREGDRDGLAQAFARAGYQRVLSF
jgi:hypothetical protein